MVPLQIGVSKRCGRAHGEGDGRNLPLLPDTREIQPGYEGRW